MAELGRVEGWGDDVLLYTFATLEQDFLAAVGLVAIASSDLEVAAARLQSLLARGNEMAEIMGSGLTFDQMCQSCRALTDARIDLPAELRTSIRTKLIEAKALYDKRSNVVHGGWFQSAQSNPQSETVRLSMRRRRWGKLDPIPWTVGTLNDLALELHRKSAEVGRLGDEVGEAPSIGPGTRATN